VTNEAGVLLLAVMAVCQ